MRRTPNGTPRYRTVDGYSVWRRTSALAYQAGQGPFISGGIPEPYISNFRVMQREMSVRDTLLHRESRPSHLGRGRGGDQ